MGTYERNHDSNRDSTSQCDFLEILCFLFSEINASLYGLRVNLGRRFARPVPTGLETSIYPRTKARKTQGSVVARDDAMFPLIVAHEKLTKKWEETEAPSHFSFATLALPRH